MTNNVLICSDELYHYGIKSMKWGQRRYQNADGTWTAAGLERRAARERKNTERETKQKEKEKKEISDAIAKGNAVKVKKYFSKMTTDEVRAAISRIELNTKVSELSTKNTKNHGQKIVSMLNTAVAITSAIDKISGSAKNVKDNIAKLNGDETKEEREKKQKEARRNKINNQVMKTDDINELIKIQKELAPDDVKTFNDAINSKSSLKKYIRQINNQGTDVVSNQPIDLDAIKEQIIDEIENQ